MPDDKPKTTEELHKVEAAIAAQEGLRGILPDEQIDATVATLRGQMTKLQRAAAAEGSAVAQEGGTAVAERGIAARDIEGHAVTGDHNKVGDEYHYHAAPAVASAADKALARYLNRLYARCNALPLAAMGGEETGGKEVLLENVYVALDTITRVRLNEEELEKRRKRAVQQSLFDREEERPVTALEAATQASRLVLLGDPGGGKSSFVKQLAAWLALARLGKQEPPEGWPPLLPLLVNLRDLAPRLADVDLNHGSAVQQNRALRRAVLDLWAHELAGMDASELAPELPDWLDRGDVLLIFDGLDEVPLAGRERVRRAVAAVLGEHGAVARVVVTCRSRSYTGHTVLPGFTAHTLAPFDNEKISRFVDGWYGTQAKIGRISRDEAKEKTADLRAAATASDLAELSSNPMLLTTMAIIHQQEVGLPKERVRLYSQAVQVLLRRWQKRKGLAASDRLEAVLADDRKLRGILERLAHEAHRQQSRGEAGDLERKEVLALLESRLYLGDIGLAAEFLDYVDQRSGLLVGRGGDDDGQPALYGFPHRTFQEYLAGCYLIAERDAARRLWEYAAEGDFWYLAVQLGTEELLYNSTAGRNTYLDLAYDLCRERPPERDVDWRALVWSGRMASLLGRDEIVGDTKPGGGRAFLERLIDRLPPALPGGLPAVERAEAGRVLARLGDPRREVMEADAMPFCLVPAGPFMMGSPDDDPDAGDSEKPLHEVDIPYDFWIGQFPVTNAQYRAFAQDGGYQRNRYWPEAIAAEFWREGRFKGSYENKWRDGPVDYGEPFTLDNHPVVGVTWYEALAFTRWLTERWRAAGRLPAWLAVTLPSEAEWEKAARGGLRIPSAALPVAPGAWAGADGVAAAVEMVDNPLPERRYPWGDEWDAERANGEETGIGSASAMGVFVDQGNVHGAAELSGNVFEWTRSRFDKYPYNPGDGRENIREITPDSIIVIRGGAYWNNASRLRCAYRIGRNPYGRLDLGFRVIVSPFLPPLASGGSEL